MSFLSKPRLSRISLLLALPILSFGVVSCSTQSDRTEKITLVQLTQCPETISGEVPKEVQIDENAGIVKPETEDEAVATALFLGGVHDLKVQNREGIVFRQQTKTFCDRVRKGETQKMTPVPK